MTGQGLLTPEQIIDAGLAASRTEGCVVVVLSSSQANVRWANNTVTTNGVATSVDFFVVAMTDQPFSWDHFGVLTSGLPWWAAYG